MTPEKSINQSLGSQVEESLDAFLSQRLPDSIPTPAPVSFGATDIQEFVDTNDPEPGTLYEIRDPTPGSEILITLKYLDIPDEQNIEDLEKTLQAWKRISGTGHIHTLLDWDLTNEPWVLLENANGGSLREQLPELTIGQRLFTALVVLQALSYAHNQGVVHLKLAPSTIRFKEVLSGTWSVPLVTNWALASVDRDENTDRYVAPEQLDPEMFGRESQSTDVYRAATVIQEMFTGTQPGSPEQPDSLRELPIQINNVLQSALSDNKMFRYATIDDFRRAIEGIVAEYSSASAVEAMLGIKRNVQQTAFHSSLTQQEQAAIDIIQRVDGPITARSFTVRTMNSGFTSLQNVPGATKTLESLVEKGQLTKFKDGKWYYKLRDDATPTDLD